METAMASNEERREVAENLRNLTIGRSIQYKEQFFDELAEVVVGFEDYHDFNVVLEKLSDLIDPQERTCKNVCDEDETTLQYSFVCSECGAICSDVSPRYCPNCGAKVVDE